MSVTIPLPAVRPQIWLLLLIAFTGTLAMHSFVPALPLAQASLDVSTQQVQLTISIYAVGLAIGQLLYGPVSDALGRRPAVFAGLAIYLAGTLGAYLAPSLPVMLCARFVQALGGAGGMALSRAMARDGCDEARAIKNLATMNLVLLVAPGVAPIVGSVLATQLGWRSIFLALGLLGGLTFFLAALRLPETIVPSGRFHMASMASDYRRLLADRRFMLYTFGGCLTSMGSYAYFASAPYILHGRLEVPLSRVGMFVGATLAGASIGTLFARLLVGKIDKSTVMIGAVSCAVVNAAMFAGLSWAQALTPGRVVFLTVTQLFFAGIASPTALGAALSVNPGRAGSASGIYGFCQMMIGGACSAAVGLGSNPAIACGVVMVSAYALALLAFLKVRPGR